MKIKSAATLAGLTTRAVRFYMEEGLISPETLEHNGRNFVEFSDEDVERLKLIASLRDAMLSVAQIRAILVQPELTGEVFEEYRVELEKNFSALSELIGRVNVIDSARLCSAQSLRDAISGTQVVEVAKDDAPYVAKPGTCDDGIPLDERRLAYEKWQKKQARRDKLSFLTDWIYRIGEIPAAIFVIIPVAAFVVYIAFNIIANLHEEIPVDIDGTGYEFAPGTDELDMPLKVKAKGTIYRMYFKPDYYIGTLEIEGYEVWDTSDRWTHEGESVYIQLVENPELRSSKSSNIRLWSEIRKKSSYFLEYRKPNTHFMLTTLYFNEYGNQLVIGGYERVPRSENVWTGGIDYFLTAPSDSPVYARIDAARILPRIFYGDGWYDEYKSAYRNNSARLEKELTTNVK